MLVAGELIGCTFLAWFVLVLLHGYRLDHPRCPHCHQPQLSPLDARLHTFACAAPSAQREPMGREPRRPVGQPTRSARPDRVGNLESRSPRR